MAGSFAAGSSYPLVVPYLIIGAFIPVPLLLLIRATDSAPKQRAARLLQAIRVPRHIWAAFSVACCRTYWNKLVHSDLRIFRVKYRRIGWMDHGSVEWITRLTSACHVCRCSAV